MNREGEVCTLLLRFRFEELSLISWNVSCGPPTPVPLTEEDASALTGCDDALICQQLGPGEQPLFVFYAAPLDGGDVWAVSETRGVEVFGGSIVHAGTGDVDHPARWRREAVTSNCEPTALGSFEYYNVYNGRVFPQQAPAAIVETIETSALAAALDSASLAVRTILLYPRSVGAFDPANAEYVVVLESGSESRPE